MRLAVDMLGCLATMKVNKALDYHLVPLASFCGGRPLMTVGSQYKLLAS